MHLYCLCVYKTDLQQSQMHLLHLHDSNNQPTNKGKGHDLAESHDLEH